MHSPGHAGGWNTLLRNSQDHLLIFENFFLIQENPIKSLLVLFDSRLVVKDRLLVFLNCGLIVNDGLLIR